MVEKKSPVATVKTEEKKASVGTVKATVDIKSADAGKAAPKPVVKEEKKPAAKKAAVKKPAAKKAAAKKPAVKKEVSEPSAAVILQYAGREIEGAELVQRVKDIWAAEGRAAADLKDIKLYVKPEEYTVYYVVNGDITGSFDL